MKRRVQSLEEYRKSKTPQAYEEYVNIKTQELDEKSVSIVQQRLFGMAYAVRSGAMERKDVPPSVRGIVDSNMTDEQIKDFAKTSHTGLPLKKEGEENTNEAMVQVAGKNKPSGAKVLAVTIIDFMEKENYFKPGFADAKSAVIDEVTKVIIDSTF